jgi:hypothetical protein
MGCAGSGMIYDVRNFISSIYETILPLDPMPNGSPDLRPIQHQLLSPQGLAGLFITYPRSYSDPPTTTILFQPSLFTYFNPSSTSRLVLPGEVRLYRPQPFSTPSGNYMLLCVDASLEEFCQDKDVASKLHLVHFTNEPPSLEVRQLEMPFFINPEMDSIHSMAVDDHLGVVYLAHDEGYIFSVPFA